jgi:threonine synthase
LNDGDTVVCTLTGHGLKDPDTAMSTAIEPVKVGPEVDKIVKAMGF